MRMKTNVHMWLSVIFCMVTSIAFSQAPIISSFNPSSGPVGTLVTLTGSNLQNPTGVSIGGVPAILVSSNSTELKAMVMPGAVTGVVQVSNGSGTSNNLNSFEIEETRFPSVSNSSVLSGQGAIGQSYQGRSVSISADGNTAVVGGFLDNNGEGGAWVFIRDNGVWTQQGGKLLGTGGTHPNVQQGSSTAISADGNTIAIGGVVDGIGIGAVWVFTRNAGVWSQQGNKLIGTGAVGPAIQGASVSLSADGNSLIVGGYADDSYNGAAWIFTRNAGVWSQQGNKLVGTGAIGQSYQGMSVSISADGNTAVVGGHNDNNGVGAAWVFSRSGNQWIQQGNKLVGSGSIGNSNQGKVSISADGNTVIIGGSADDSYKGAIWIFNRTGVVWNQVGNKMTGSYAIGTASFGSAVSIAASGDAAIVSGVNDNNGRGAIWILRKLGNNWVQEGNKIVGATNGLNNPEANQGISIALSADATTAIVGAWRYNNMVGNSWIFSTNNQLKITDVSSNKGSIGSLITISGVNLKNILSISISGVNTLPISNDGQKLVVMVMPGTSSGSLSYDGGDGAQTPFSNFTIESTSGPIFTNNLKVVNPNSAATRFGSNVVISAEGTTAAISEPADNNGVGAVTVFIKKNGTWIQQGSKLIGTNVIGNTNTGMPIVLSADGNTLVFSRWRDNSGIGATWVFKRVNGVWTQEGEKIIGTGYIGNAEQGRSISLSADGNTLLIGGEQDNSGIGAVWVFIRNGNSWVQDGSKIVGSGYVGVPRQGVSVAMSADGKSFALGGPADNANGAVWVFRKSSNLWVQDGNKLVGSGMNGSNSQGVSVAMNADGNVVVVGSPFDGTGTGATWVFKRLNGVWGQDGNKLIGSDAIGAPVQAQSVSINAEGNRILVGGPSDFNGVGTAWTFVNTSGIWSQQGNKLNFNGFINAPLIGTSVALSADGKNGIIGGPLDNSVGAFWTISQQALPQVSSVSPVLGSVGSLIRIAGTNLKGLETPKINGVNTLVVSQYDDLITLMVMPGSTSGSITVPDFGSIGNFTVLPTPLPKNQDGRNLAPIYTMVGGAPRQTPLFSSVAISADGKRSAIGLDLNYNSGNLNEAISFKRTNLDWVFERFTEVDPAIISSTFKVGSKITSNADLTVIDLLNGLRNANYFFENGEWKRISSTYGVSNGMFFPDENQTISMSANGRKSVYGTYNSLLQAASANSNRFLSYNPASILNLPIYGNTAWLAPNEKAPRVAISSDGDITAVGTPDINGGRGGLLVYKFQNNKWNWESGFLAPSDVIGITKFGSVVAINADGNTVAVGAQNDNFNTGAIWVYRRTSGVWTQMGGKIVPNDLIGPGQFGAAISISADGNTIMVSAPDDDGLKGAFWFFRYDNGIWQQQGNKLRVVDDHHMIWKIGSSLALSANGSAAIVTGMSTRTLGQSVWMLTSNAAPIINSFTPLTGSTGNSITITGSGFTDVTSVKIGNADVSNFTIIDDNTISAIVGNGSSGPIILQNSNNAVGFSSTNFTFLGAGVPGGGTGGLESKSLGDAVGKRIINNAISNRLGAVDYSKMVEVDPNGQTYRAASTGTSLTLAQILPKKITNSDYKAYTSTPTDIPSFTNAVEALSIDFTIQNKARAVAFGTKTLGTVYDHTKAVCDRLKGAELLKIETVNIGGINLVKFDLINAKGQNEYAYSFVIGAKNGRNDLTIQSTWLNKNYSPDEVMFNIQLWGETPGLINDMANDIISRLSQSMTLREIANNIELPQTYITKGKRVADHIVLNISNTTNRSTGYFEVMERANEQSNNLIKKQIPFTLSANGNTTIKVPASDLYESTISMYLNGKMEDQVFMADGNWGTELTTNSASIKSFKVSNSTKPVVDSSDDFKLYRNVQLEANAQGNVIVYKMLRGGGAPQDLREYKTFKFKAAGSGANLKIILLRDSISNWDDQYSVTIPLNSNEVEYKLGLNEFKSKTYSSALMPNDITTVIFIYQSTGNSANSLINAELSNLSFSKTDYAYLNSLNSREITIYPNPANRRFFASFKSPKEVGLILTLRDAASGRALFTKSVYAVKGENTVPVDLINVASLSNCILSLEGADVKYIPKKVMLTIK